MVPGAVKKLRRFGFKTEDKYDGDYGQCHDLVQATAEVEVGHLSDGGTVFAAWTIAGYSLQRIDVHIG